MYAFLPSAQVLSKYPSAERVLTVVLLPFFDRAVALCYQFDPPPVTMLQEDAERFYQQLNLRPIIRTGGLDVVADSGEKLQNKWKSAVSKRAGNSHLMRIRGSPRDKAQSAFSG